MTEGKRVVIVGAGVAGLSVGFRCAEAGMRVFVIEKERSVGGLARSFYYGPFVFDIGPHRFHTDDLEVLAFIEEVLDNKYLVMPRRSGVWLFGRYHDWPLRISTLPKLPPGVVLRVVRDLFRKQVRSGASFEDYILNRYGQTLYDYFFKVYTRKFLKHPPETIHADWARVGIDRAVIDRRLRMDTLFEVLKRALIPAPVTTEFIYPRTGGIDTFSRSLAQKIEEQGGEIRLGVSPARLDSAGQEIRSIALSDGAALPADVVIWTAPLDVLCELTGVGSTDLTYLSAVLYNIEVSGIPPVRYQWCYYGQEDILFNRISIPRYFSEATCPPDATGVGVEVTCAKGDEVWNLPESQLARVESDMQRVGLLGRRHRVQAAHIERVENVYPIYTLDYLHRLERTMNRLAHIQNLVLLGRTGTFWYNNMDHSIRSGLECADDILASERGGLLPVYRRHDFVGKEWNG